MGFDGKISGLADFEAEVSKLLAELDRYATKIGT
jgi:hypothetical protein